MRSEAEVRARLIEELKKLPLVEITGSGSYAKVRVTGMTEGCFDIEGLEDFKNWNVSWIAIEYRHLHQLIKKLGSGGGEG